MDNDIVKIYFSHAILQLFIANVFLNKIYGDILILIIDCGGITFRVFVFWCRQWLQLIIEIKITVIVNTFGLTAPPSPPSPSPTPSSTTTPAPPVTVMLIKEIVLHPCPFQVVTARTARRIIRDILQELKKNVFVK